MRHVDFFSLDVEGGELSPGCTKRTIGNGGPHASTPHRAKDRPHSVTLWAYMIDAAHNLGIDAYAQSCECTQSPQWCAVCTVQVVTLRPLVDLVNTL